jgi:hypothetical protein
MVSVWDAAIGEEDHHLMDRLGVLGEVVPERVRILQMSLRITLLGVNEVWELGRVTKEEHRCVVEDLSNHK